MLELHESDRKIDHLTVAETLRQHGKLEEVGGPEAIDELAGWVPAAGHAREYGRIVRDNAQLRALLLDLLRDPGERALTRGARARSGRARRASGARGRPRRPPEEVPRRSPRSWTRRPTSSTACRSRRPPLTGTPSGFKDLDDADRRLPAGQPDHPRRAAIDGQVGAGDEHRRERGRWRITPWRCSRSRCPSPSSRSASSPRRPGSRARSCARAGWPRTAGRRSSRPASDSPDAPLWVDDSSDTGVLEVRAKARRLHHQLPQGLGLIIVDYLQLMRHEGRVESRVEQVGQISPWPEVPGARARACR